MKTFLISLFTLLSTTALAQNPLQPFESIIGGEWWLGEDSYQTFEWGVGKLSVKGSSFFIVNGEPLKVSEGEWFFHPGEKKIKGFFTAQNMPITFFDYETTFNEEGNMINTIVGFGSMGDGIKFFETWEFNSENSFIWTLFEVQNDGTHSQMMSGEYRKK